jgi:hypothetical protein
MTRRDWQLGINMILIALMLQTLALAQARGHVTLRVNFPDGTSRDAVNVPEGTDQIMIAFRDQGTYHSFYQSPKIVDSEAVLVGVQSTRDGDVIDTVRLRLGDPAIGTATSPSFRLSVLNIDR